MSDDTAAVETMAEAMWEEGARISSEYAWGEVVRMARAAWAALHTTHTVVPKAEPPDLPTFVTVDSRSGTSARWWCDECDWGGGWVSPREAFDGAYSHVSKRHSAAAVAERQGGSPDA